MNVNQIAFIICADNEQYYNECVRYINELEVPEHFTTDIICIQEADSMVQGYRAGMQASDAKYKVYLRQDVFILNRNFIPDLLNIFKKDEKIGLIGMAGCSKLPENADCMECWDVGSMEVFDGRTLADDFKLRQPEKEYESVMAVQGTIMITQYDIGWQEVLEDVLDGWDFYDIALSLEMKKQGYLAVVPKQSMPWCYHIKLWNDLKEYTRLRFQMIQQYPDVFKSDENREEALKKFTEQSAQVCSIRNNMIRIMEKGMYQVMEELAEEIRLSWPGDMQVREIANMMEIYELEEASNICMNHSEWFRFHSWPQMYEFYNWIRFALLRIAFHKEDERIEELKKKVLMGRISKDAISKISSISLRNTTAIYEYLLDEKTDQPLVSVIIAVYNGEDTIGKTIESVLGQTYENIEIIIVDDASTDKSREIISAYRDERIKTYFLDQNNNVCNAGNVGFHHAKGKYVALIGHDDLWEKEKLFKQVAFLEEHSAYSACFTWIDVIDENGKKNNQENMKLRYKLSADNFSQGLWIHRMMKTSNYMCAPSACIRKEMLERTGYYRYGLLQLQDFDLWLRLLTEGPVYFLQERLTYYRQFTKGGKNKNLSAVNPGQLNRTCHEERWVQYHFIETMQDIKFIRLFCKYMKNPKAEGKKEILCEKAFILWNFGNCFAVKLFIELLEDEEIRDILKTKYQFELNDFYNMNRKSMFFDPGYKDI